MIEKAYVYEANTNPNGRKFKISDQFQGIEIPETDRKKIFLKGVQTVKDLIEGLQKHKLCFKVVIQYISRNSGNILIKQKMMTERRRGGGNMKRSFPFKTIFRSSQINLPPL